jgi:hypothetical protein
VGLAGERRSLPGAVLCRQIHDDVLPRHEVEAGIDQAPLECRDRRALRGVVDRDVMNAARAMRRRASKAEQACWLAVARPPKSSIVSAQLFTIS